MTDEENTAITLESLFDLLRKEKGNENLQKLDSDFMKKILDYLKEKHSFIVQNESSSNIFASQELEKAKKQLDNTKRTLKELYDRRETKIANMAIISSRTGQDMVDTSSFLEPEMHLYKHLHAILDSFRQSTLNNIMCIREPTLPSIDASSSSSQPKEQQKPEKATKIVKFLHSVPKFVGKNLEIYGPFEPEDIANLPSEIADVLLYKERVEEIKGQ